MKRTAFHSIEGTLVCVSGLRIGGSQDDLEIGGTDLPVIKHPVTLKPYVPGSSLKGKMRAEMEKQLGRFSGRDQNEPCGCARSDCPVCRLFGPHKNTRSELGPTRIIVRDAQLTKGGDTEATTDLIEVKTENVINRKTGAAEHPRKLERVVAGSEFDVKLRLQVYDNDGTFQYGSKRGAEALLAIVREALDLVQKTGLGSGISRGSGHIKFENLKLDGQDWK